MAPSPRSGPQGASIRSEPSLHGSQRLSSVGCRTGASLAVEAWRSNSKNPSWAGQRPRQSASSSPSLSRLSAKESRAAQTRRRSPGAPEAGLKSPRSPARSTRSSYVPTVPPVGSWSPVIHPQASDILERHREACEKVGKYEEAELAETRLREMRSREESRLCDELYEKLAANINGVEDAHVKEMQEFVLAWDDRAREFDEHADRLKTTLLERQRREVEEYMERLNRETEPRAPRWSKQLLNGRKVQETLVKMQKYGEAKELKLANDQLEQREERDWQAKRDAKIASCQKQFEEKQFLEMKGLLKRIQSGREELMVAKTNEQDRLQRRYKNVRAQLLSQEKIASLRVEKTHLGSTLAAVASPKIFALAGG